MIFVLIYASMFDISTAFIALAIYYGVIATFICNLLATIVAKVIIIVAVGMLTKDFVTTVVAIVVFVFVFTSAECLVAAVVTIVIFVFVLASTDLVGAAVIAVVIIVRICVLTHGG